MAGTAKTNKFMLGTATVMIGAQADLLKLNPDEHSIGLVKNFSMSAEPSYTDLAQGVQNTLVFSKMTGNEVRASMEAYEFTAQNLNYALGLNGSGVSTMTVNGSVNGAVTGDGSVAVFNVQTGEGSNFSTDDYVAIDINGDDNVVIRKVASVSTDAVTVTQALDTGVNLPDGAVVRKVNMVGIGSKVEQPFLSAKVVGKLADGSTIALEIPKIRVVNGFTLAFSTDDYGNLPLELTVYDQVTTDPMFAEFGGAQGESARVYLP
ncbi:hypothetical protein [Kiloniella sp.]|uniref:hypothetical protein n=1 Tax=Kiloniella sp. TaxID=1938587 RepID=UPI003B023C3D